MKKKRNIKNKLNKKGEGEWWKFINGIIAIAVLIIIIMFIFKYWPALSKGVGKLGDTAIGLTEGVKPIIDNTFGLLSKDGRRDKVISLLADRGECNSDNVVQLTKEYNDALNEIKKHEVTDKEKLSRDLRIKLINCYKMSSNLQGIASLGAGVTSQEDKLFIINSLIDAAISNPTKDRIDLAKSEALKHFPNGLPDSIKKRLEELDKVRKSFEGNEKKFEELKSAYIKADTLEALRTLSNDENFRELLSKDTQVMKSFKNSINYKTALLNAKQNPSCQEFQIKLRQYVDRKSYENLYLINNNGVEDKNKPIFAEALREIADRCITEDQTIYYLYYSKLLEEFPNSLGIKSTTFKNSLKNDCLENTKNIDYSVCERKNKGFGNGLFRCYWKDTVNDYAPWGWTGGNTGSCFSCATITLKSCDAYSSKSINPSGHDTRLRTHEWQPLCEQDPCGFSATGCIIKSDSCIAKSN